MKNILFFVLLIPVIANSQDLPPAGGGGRKEPQKTECISPAERADIEKMLDSNRKVLREKARKKKKNKGRKITATMFGWPLHQVFGSYYNYYGVSNYVDHDPGYPGDIMDWNCGTRSYDLSSGYNHGGMDIFLWPFDWNMMEEERVEIVAAAPGTIIGKTDGNFDHNCAMGSGTWNAVYIEHADGTVAWYGHMKTGSTTSKPIGATVALGERLGFVGSSGSSTGPHLHFEVHDASGAILDPYNGSCNLLPSMWTSQKPYYESAVNALITHYATPGWASCPLRDTIRAQDTFLPGSTIYFASYYHDQLSGQSAAYKILRPDGSTYYSWSHSSSVAHYSASWWYWYYTIPATEPLGTWKFVNTFQSVTYIHDFYLLNSSLESANVADEYIGVYPNPAHDIISINAKAPCEAEMINAFGQRVFSQKDVLNAIDVSQMPNGIYCLRLTAAGKTSTHKIMVSNNSN